MRIVFCGSGSFATPSLNAIIETRHEVACVVTQPPRRAGRGGKLRPTAVSLLARDAGLDLLEPADVNADQTVAAIGRYRPDVLCVVEFGQMIRRQVRRQASVDAFNLHGSLLPALRGAAPVNWAIIRGCGHTGVTTFSLADAMDAGPIYLKAETDIRPGETAEMLRRRLAAIGADVVCRTLDLLAAGQAAAAQQDEAAATLAPRLKKSDGIIDWTAAAQTICNLIHGTWPWPGGQATYHRKDGQQTPVIIASAAAEQSQAGGEAGLLDAELTVGAGQGRLRIIEIKPAGKRLMTWRDFVNGHRVGQGDRFETQKS